nr:transcriptional regulator [Pseudoclavibacter sp. Marseille-Q3772]
METRPFIHTTERMAAVVRDARQRQGLTQSELASRASVGRKFIIALEGAHPRAEVGKVLDVLTALGLQPRAIPVPPAWASTADDEIVDADT